MLPLGPTDEAVPPPHSNPMTPAQYKTVRSMIETRLGVVLPEGSELQVETRLQKLAEGLGIASVLDLFQAFGGELVPDPPTVLTQAIIDKETAFFRDMVDFGALKNSVLPTLIQRRAGERRLTFWSAGCSTGQEPYSIAIFLREQFPELAGWDLKIHATEFNRDSVEKAREAHYTKDEVNHGLPAPLLIKYFKKIEGHWQLTDSIRQMVEVHQGNLVEAGGRIPGADVVFLRHVLKNLNGPTQEGILNTVGSSLSPDGCLFMTESKGIPGLENQFYRIELPDSAFYRPKTYIEAGS